MKGDEVSIVVTAKRLFAPADISSAPMAACLAKKRGVRLQSPQVNHLDCNRIKLPDFVMDFLLSIKHRDGSEIGHRRSRASASASLGSHSHS